MPALLEEPPVATPVIDTATASAEPAKQEPAKKRTSADAAPAPDLIDDDAARLFTERFLNATSDRKPSAPKKEKKAKEEAPVEESVKEAPKPKAKAKVEAVDYEKIGEAVTKAVRESAPEPKREEARKPEQSKLPAQELRKVEYLKSMEQSNPDKYKGVAEKYSDGLVRSAEYEANWKKEHPGEAFDKSDSQHDAFFDTVAVDWEDADYIEAVAESKANERTMKLREEMEQKERSRELEPKARQLAAESARSLMEGLGLEPDYVKADGTLDEAKLAELEATEPAKADVLRRSADTATKISGEIERLFNGAVEFNQKNQLHHDISNFAISAEKAMLARPTDEQVQDGRKFVSAADFNGMTREQRSKHWTFTASDLRYLAVQDIKAGAEKLIADEEKRFESWAARKGLAAKSGNQPEKASAEQPAKTVSKPQSPTSTVEPKLAGVKGQSGSKQQQAEVAWTERFLGRRLTS